MRFRQNLRIKLSDDTDLAELNESDDRSFGVLNFEINSTILHYGLLNSKHQH